ncbi:helix-turn-helix domain-containing protein [Roseobacter sp. CCS2]|uniref:helix-turn-helix domain-containing protein n=1 Tax=Roseobacter sp. CCS2 TaxID=391593 RepID=UPI0018DE1332
MTPLLSPQETAEILGVCTKTLQNCRALGLRCVRVTRNAIKYRPDDVQAFIEERTECHSEQKRPASTNMTSSSKVVDFAEAVAPKTTKKLRR